MTTTNRAAREIVVEVTDTASVTDDTQFFHFAGAYPCTETFWSRAVNGPAGFVVTVFPTRDGCVRARVHANGHGAYTGDHKSYAELFLRLSEITLDAEQGEL